MVATTDQKARLLDLVTGVLELTRDGNRDVEDVASVLQVIKEKPDFAARLLAKAGNAASPIFSRDMREEGWELVENVNEEPVPASDLELVYFLKWNESCISGEKMRKRARQQNASLSQRQAEDLLHHQDEIPAIWRPYRLNFPGTLWWGGSSCVYPVLEWLGSRWEMGWHFVEDGRSDDDRLLRRPSTRA